MSQSQTAQLGGNVEFRTNLWKKVIEAQLNNVRGQTIFWSRRSKQLT